MYMIIADGDVNQKLRTKAKTNMAIFQHLKPLKRYTIFRINTNLKLTPMGNLL